MVKLLLWLICSIACGVLYRMGGSDKYNTKVRDLGVPFVFILSLSLWAGWSWWLVLCFGLMFGALTTYWGKKGSDKTFLNYFLHGLGVAVAMLPYAISMHHYIGFIIRCLVVSLGIAYWSIYVGNDIREEFGRGVIIGSTLPLLLF